MSKIKVSVIIPVYNVEKYLRKCLESVINQTLEEIEIIVINDGSTDNSKRIIAEFEEKDTRIKVINQKNQGLSMARNSGLKIATGEYVGFIDSDDYIEIDMYEKMYKKAKEMDSDVVSCNYKNIFSKYEEIVDNFNDELIKIDKQNIEKFWKINYEEIVTPVWNKIYRRSLIVKNKIEFVSNNIISSEDILFNLQYISEANNIFNMKEVFYNYMRREDSITTSKKARKNMMKRCIHIAELFDNHCNEKNYKMNELVLYIFHEELAIGLSYSNKLNVQAIANEINIARKSYLFNSYINKILYGNKLYSYGKYKNGYPIIKKLFDKIFAILVKLKLTHFAAFMQILRFKRVQKLNLNIELNS